MIRGHLSLDELSPLHQDQHRLLFQNCLGVVEKVFTTAPTADNIPVGYAAIYESGSTRRLYFNVNGTVTYIAFGVGSDDSGDMLYADTRFEVGSFTRDISLTTSQEINLVGAFQPKAVMFFSAFGSYGYSIGAVDGTRIGMSSMSGTTPNYTSNNEYAIYITDGTNTSYATLTSLDSDGFTLAWAKSSSPTGTTTIVYIAFR